LFREDRLEGAIMNELIGRVADKFQKRFGGKPLLDRKSVV
jgi:hypothetical protein